MKLKQFIEEMPDYLSKEPFYVYLPWKIIGPFTKATEAFRDTVIVSDEKGYQAMVPLNSLWVYLRN